MIAAASIDKRIDVVISENPFSTLNGVFASSMEWALNNRRNVGVSFSIILFHPTYFILGFHSFFDEPQ